MVGPSPYFSIIIPTYQRGNNICQTLKTVQNQNYPHWECLVVDDGGNDNTNQVIKDLNDNRFRYFWKENGERGAARNFGIKKANGQYVTFLDSDDILYPHYLEEALHLIRQHPEGCFYHLAYEIKTQDGNVIDKCNHRRGNLNKQLVTGNHLSNIGVVLPKQIACNNLYNENRELSGSEDYELWLRLAAQYPIYYSNKVCAALIQHGDRSVITGKPEQLIKRIHLLAREINKNKEVMDYLGGQYQTFLAHRFFYLALHLAMGGYFQLSLKLWLKAISIKPLYLFHYKSGGVVKNLVLNSVIKGLKNKIKYFLLTFSV